MAKYSEEMRQQIAAYIIESKRSITQVAKEIGVNVNTLCRWVNDYRKRHNMPTYAVENGIKWNRRYCGNFYRRSTTWQIG